MGSQKGLQHVVDVAHPVRFACHVDVIQVCEHLVSPSQSVLGLHQCAVLTDAEEQRHQAF